MSLLIARELAQTLGGEPIEVKNDQWLVIFDRPDGRVVTLSESSVEEYYDRTDFAAGRCYCSIKIA